MKNLNYTWSTSDGIKLFAQSWLPEEDKKILVILVHGLGEHSSRYEHWAELFTEKGYSFLSMDLRGHGRSEGKKGHAKSMDQLLNDIDLLYDKANEIFSGYKIILYGHSMGAAILLNHVIKRNRPMDALIVTSPWLRLVNEPSEFLITVTGFLKYFLPSFTISNGLDAGQLSHDPEVGREYERDPLVHDRISLKLFHEIHDGGKLALRNIYKINCPFLVMHGTEDSIASSKASEEFVMNTGKNTRLKLWENQYHELHNEFIKKEVFDYIINWLAEYKL